jgi:hypothetical protein
MRDPEWNAGDQVRSTWYRRVIYQQLEQLCFQKIRAHKSPEPWLSFKCALQVLAGDGWFHAQRRHEGIVGGLESEREYQTLVSGKVAMPLLLVAGYPRSGTTALQTVVRSAFNAYIVEIPTENKRFSLWDYPKHNPSVIKRAVLVGKSSIRVVAVARQFEECAASLIVGRGGVHLVNLDKELALWESWLEVYNLEGVYPIVFSAITNSKPKQIAQLISQITDLLPNDELAPDDTYSALMLRLGKGDTDNPMQSNVPSELRSEKLQEALEWVRSQLGVDRRSRLEAAYSSIPFVIASSGTISP